MCRYDIDFNGCNNIVTPGGPRHADRGPQRVGAVRSAGAAEVAVRLVVAGRHACQPHGEWGTTWVRNILLLYRFI